jgi:hypothetical protein
MCEEGFFSVLRVSREDIANYYPRALELSDSDMKMIADELACESLEWSLDIAVLYIAAPLAQRLLENRVTNV